MTYFLIPMLTSSERIYQSHRARAKSHRWR